MCDGQAVNAFLMHTPTEHQNFDAALPPGISIRQTTLASLEESTHRSPHVCSRLCPRQRWLTAHSVLGLNDVCSATPISQQRTRNLLGFSFLKIFIFTEGYKLILQPAQAISQKPDLPRNQTRNTTCCALTAASRGPVPTTLCSQNEKMNLTQGETAFDFSSFNILIHSRGRAEITWDH